MYVSCADRRLLFVVQRNLTIDHNAGATVQVFHHGIHYFPSGVNEVHVDIVRTCACDLRLEVRRLLVVQRDIDT